MKFIRSIDWFLHQLYVNQLCLRNVVNVTFFAWPRTLFSFLFSLSSYRSLQFLVSYGVHTRVHGLITLDTLPVNVVTLTCLHWRKRMSCTIESSFPRLYAPTFKSSETSIFIHRQAIWGITLVGSSIALERQQMPVFDLVRHFLRLQVLKWIF